MSANLLEKVTPGPMHYAGQGILTTLDGEDEIALGLLYDDSPDGQLHALAYDHALWGAACAAKKASCVKVENDCFYLTVPGRIGRTVTLDAFGCPALTPELREALKKSLGLAVA